MSKLAMVVTLDVVPERMDEYLRLLHAHANGGGGHG
jgi:hypothetical protein